MYGKLFSASSLVLSVGQCGVVSDLPWFFLINKQFRISAWNFVWRLKYCLEAATFSFLRLSTNDSFPLFSFFDLGFCVFSFVKHLRFFTSNDHFYLTITSNDHYFCRNLCLRRLLTRTFCDTISTLFSIPVIFGKFMTLALGWTSLLYFL